MKDIEQIADYMREHKLVLATAESCTAGLIAATLADVPGAGALLDCSFVTYSEQAKRRCLKVSEITILRHNLTSEPVAREMALGALARSRANVAISNTGVVDDTDDEVPAGTQCFAWAFRSQSVPEGVAVFSATRRFQGDRVEIRRQSAEFALRELPVYHTQHN
ncbi:MAG: CinA family protein [Alcaligenaceae bacterium]|nr:CinA family protein [Alcaligenaceae bacterium]